MPLRRRSKHKVRGLAEILDHAVAGSVLQLCRPRNPMRRNLCTWFLAALLPMPALCESVRRLTGKVLFPDGKPAQGAVVKLEDQTKAIRTALSSADGSFQFSRLLPDIDYQVRATFADMESHRVRWSRLSSRKEREVTLILRPVRRIAMASTKSAASAQARIGAGARATVRGTP
jgi:hypothetical protein